MSKLNWLLVFIPIAIALEYEGANPIGCSGVSGSDRAAGKADGAVDGSSGTLLGPTYGGLLSATMGNAPELIIGSWRCDTDW